MLETHLGTFYFQGEVGGGGEFDKISYYMASNETSILLNHIEILFNCCCYTLILSGPVESIEVGKLYFFPLENY